MEGGRLSQPRHCRKGVQPVPKAVHCSGCRDNHNCPQSLTPQSVMPPLDHCNPQRHVGVNNLPKVVTQQRGGWELNSQPSNCKSNALTTRLPSHPTFSEQERIIFVVEKIMKVNVYNAIYNNILVCHYEACHAEKIVKMLLYPHSGPAEAAPTSPSCTSYGRPI